MRFGRGRDWCTHLHKGQFFFEGTETSDVILKTCWTHIYLLYYKFIINKQIIDYLGEGGGSRGLFLLWGREFTPSSHVRH